MELGKIDLHMHTTVSDGTDTPEQILQRVKEEGIRCFSVTDHDSIKAASILPELLGKEDPFYIPGVEFSCRDELGKYHILGYGYDASAPSINHLVELGHSYRMRKVRARIDKLAEMFQVTFPEEEIEKLLAMDNPGKPHLGNLMVQYGYASDRQEAIREYINRAKVKSEFIGPQEAIEGILASGGIPVLAHPCFGSGDQSILGQELEERVERLAKAGLAGLEAFYSGFSEEHTREVLALAGKYKLCVTAGSDYHGTNKTVKLGDTGVLDRSREIPMLSDFLNRAGLVL